MAIITNINYIQTIVATITGIDTAPQFASYPDGNTDLLDWAEDNSFTFPIALTFQGDGNTQYAGGPTAEQYRTDRDYDTYVYVVPAIQENLMVAKLDMAPLIDAFAAKYLDQDTYTHTSDWLLSPIADDAMTAAVNPTVRVMKETPFTDIANSQDQTITWNGKDHHGFRFRLRVREEGTL